MNTVEQTTKEISSPSLSDNKLERLAEIINQEPAALSTACISALTDCYNLEVLERVLRQVLPERLDVAISIIVKRWEIDVDDHVARVVRYDVVRRTFVPYTEDLPAKLSDVKQRILRRRQLEQDILLEQQKLLQMHSGSITQTQNTPEPADVKNHTEAPQFAESNDDPPAEPEYHMADLTNELKSLFTFNDDVTYSLLVKCMHNVREWIDLHNKQDWNVVRFVLVLRMILAKKKATMEHFYQFVQHIFPGISSSWNTLKHRDDANKEENYERYDDPIKCKWQSCKKLKEDGSEVEDYFEPVITHIRNKQDAA